MRKTGIGFVVFAALTFAACGSPDKKAKTPAKPAITATTTPNDGAAATEKVVKAEGDMKDILLALERVHFALDSDTLTEPSREALAEAGAKLVKHPDVELHVEGHSDPRGTSEYNIALAERRARAVTEYLTRLGVTENRLHPVSYGEERPLAEGSDQRSYALNRRVDFRLMKGNVRFVLEAGTPLDDSGDAFKAAR